MVINPNSKPSVTKEFKSVINKRKQTYSTGDPLKKNIISREVRNEIRKARIKYMEKINAIQGFKQ